MKVAQQRQQKRGARERGSQDRVSQERVPQQQDRRQGVRELRPAMRLLLLTFSTLTALAVLTLFGRPEETERLFAWTIQPPLTAAFLGAGYGAGCVLVVLSLRDPVWAHNRIPMITILVFTVVSLVATLLHLDKFHFSDAGALATFAAWFWLAIYVGVPVALGLLIVRQERAPGRDPREVRPVPGVLRALLGVQSLVLLPVGAALFVAPSTAERLWPWTLTPLTARVVAAWLLAFGLATGLAVLLRVPLRRLRTSTVSYAVFGVLGLLALLRFRDELDGSRPVTWIVTGMLATIAATGAAGWWAGRARTVAAPARGGRGA